MSCIRIRGLSKALATDATTSSYPSRVPTITKPSGNGVISLADYGMVMPKRVLIMPYASGSDNDAFNMRAIGWSRVLGDGSLTTQDLWVPRTLAELTCTISAALGVANTPISASYRFADTLAAVTNGYPVYPGANSGGATTLGAITIVSPADNTPAFAILPTTGIELLEFIFDQTTGTPSMNCLYMLQGE